MLEGVGVYSHCWAHPECCFSEFTVVGSPPPFLFNWRVFMSSKEDRWDTTTAQKVDNYNVRARIWTTTSWFGAVARAQPRNHLLGIAVISNLIRSQPDWQGLFNYLWERDQTGYFLLSKSSPNSRAHLPTLTPTSDHSSRTVLVLDTS